jgi:phosphatidate cytidylyltransferase
MSDDVWRKRAHDEEDFGPPLFGDDSDADAQDRQRARKRDKPAAKPIVFDDSSGPLPHWTEPPTGEIPRSRRAGGDELRDPTDDLDVWSSFSGQVPVWSDDPVAGAEAGYDDYSSEIPRSSALIDPTGGDDQFFDTTDADISGAVARRGPGRITIGTDPTGEGMGRPTPLKGRARTSREEQARAARSNRPTGSVRATPSPPTSRSSAGVGGRDMPTAIAVGALMAAVFVGAIIWKPQAVLAIVVVVIGLAAVEYFEKVTEKGYQPASVVGIVACVASPLAAYWVGERAVPLVMAFAFIAGSVSFIGAQNLNSSPMPNMAITTLGVTWIGLAGAYGGLILGAQASGSIPLHAGTDTLLLLAVGVVVNDIGALFVGSAAGRTPLRGWISPNKSVEGFIGGALLTIITMVVVGIVGTSHTWSNPNLVLLGVVIAVMAPLGDLTESMFKRNLDVKDFGSIVKGHGGVLDRFDGFLFALPAVFYLMMVLEPWKSAVAK